MDAFRAKFGQAMHDWREAASCTKKQAAAYAGVSDTTWLSVEAGSNGAADRTLSKISKLLWGDPGAWRQVRDGADVPPFVLPEVITLDAQLAMVNEKLNEVLRRLDLRDEREAHP